MPELENLEAFRESLNLIGQSETTAEQPESASAEQSAPAEEAEGANISSVEELADYLGVGREFFDDLDVGLKVNGQEVRTKLKDALAQFQIESAAEDRLKDAKQQEAEVKSRRDALEGAYEERAMQLSNLMALARQTIAGNAQKQLEEIANLRTEDPQEYFLRRADIEDRQRQLQSLEAEYQRVVGEQVAKMRDELRRGIAEYIPEWRDQSTRDSENRRLDEYLLGQGFTSAQVQQLAEPRAIAIARKAMLYDEGARAVKKVKEKPKVQLGGTNPPERRLSAAQGKKVEALRETLKKSGSTDAFAKFYRERFNR